MTNPPEEQISDEQDVFRRFHLEGRAAIVTGGAGLLGAEFCRTLAQGKSVV